LLISNLTVAVIFVCFAGIELNSKGNGVRRKHSTNWLIAVLLALVSAGCGSSQGRDVAADVPEEVYSDAGSDVPSDVPFDAAEDNGLPDLPDSSDDASDPGDLADYDVAFDADADCHVGDATGDTCQGDAACLYEEGVQRLESEAAGLTMELDQWGGWINHPEEFGEIEATGKFGVRKLGGAWWFVTPDGNPMISKGVTDVNWLGATLQDDAFHQILVDKYGDEDAWNDAAAERIREWNFNTIGPWSSFGISQRFAHATVILDSANHAPRYDPGDVVTDYFAEPFIQHCDKVAGERAAPYVGNSGFIGYFLDNELSWGPDWRGELTLLQRYVDFPVDAPGRQEALRLVRESAADVADFNATWGTSISDWSELDGLAPADFAVTTPRAAEVTTAFQIMAFRQYASTAIAALRRVDPDHLVLGCRFAAYPGDALIEASAEYFDVISMAGYHSNWVDELDAIYPRVDKPFLIEEFSFKATDSGLMNILFYAIVVETQKDRALAFHDYVEELVRRPYTVAYHWYKWMDNPPLETNVLAGDNFGLLNFSDEPYTDFVEYARRVNYLAENWHAEGDGRFNPDRIEFPYCEVDEDAIDAIFDSMTVRQRIGQHIITQITRSGSAVDQDSLQKMEAGLMGGVFVSQITGVATGDPVKTARFVRHAQRTSMELTGVPMFVASDQEGGVYTSVNAMTGGTDSIGPTAVGSTRDDTVSFRQFDMMGREVAALGINMNFGPLLDTHYVIDNGNLNTRTFGPDTDLNARLGLAAVYGFQQNLVLPTAKHFPGDGMAAGNTHHEFVINDASLQELEAALLKPFRTAFDRGCDGVMIMPAQFSAIDDQRAAITSAPVMRDFLRGEIGFDGLIVTDDLNMYGARLGLAEGQEPGYQALKNGADMLLYVSSDPAMLSDLIDRIEAGLMSGPEDPEHIDPEAFEESTKRILRHKQKYCLFSRDYEDSTAAGAVAGRIGLPADHEMSLAHARLAVAIESDDGVLPLSGKRVLCIGPDAILPDPASGWSWLLGGTFCQAMTALDPNVLAMNYFVDGGEESAGDWVIENTELADVVVVATFQGWFSQAQQALLDRVVSGSGLPVVHVAQGVPFDLVQTAATASARVALMGSLPIMFQAGAEILFGLSEGGGLIPWNLDIPFRKRK